MNGIGFTKDGQMMNINTILKNQKPPIVLNLI